MMDWRHGGIPNEPRDADEAAMATKPPRDYSLKISWKVIVVIVLGLILWRIVDHKMRPAVRINISDTEWKGACVAIDKDKKYIRPAWENPACTAENARKQGWW